MASLLQTFTPGEIGLILAVFSFAAFAKGIAGVGYSVISISLLANLIGLKEALPLILIPSLLSNFMVMKSAGHFTETLARFKWLYLTAPLGIFLGVFVLVSIDGEVAGAFLGVTLLAYSVFALARPNLLLPKKLHHVLSAPVGFSTGVINGITGAQIMPLLPYLLALDLSPSRLVQAMNCSFTICSFALMAALGFAGKVTLPVLLMAIPSVLITYLLVRLGERVRARLSPEHFRLIILGIVAFLGARLVLQALF